MHVYPLSYAIDFPSVKQRPARMEATRTGRRVQRAFDVGVLFVLGSLAITIDLVRSAFADHRA
jgi:hypothetical protein